MNKTQLALIARIEKLGYKAPPTEKSRTNPFSGVTRNLEPLAVQLYDFITTRHHVCGRDYTRKDWDNARYLFAAKWSDEYYDLID